MYTATLLLDGIDKVNRFAHIAVSKKYDIDLLSGKYIVNGKSIMGIFSLDLTKPVTMNAYPDNDEIGTLPEEISEFLLSDKK